MLLSADSQRGKPRSKATAETRRHLPSGSSADLPKKPLLLLDRDGPSVRISLTVSKPSPAHPHGAAVQVFALFHGHGVSRRHGGVSGRSAILPGRAGRERAEAMSDRVDLTDSFQTSPPLLKPSGVLKPRRSDPARFPGRLLNQPWQALREARASTCGLTLRAPTSLRAGRSGLAVPRESASAACARRQSAAVVRAPIGDRDSHTQTIMCRRRSPGLRRLGVGETVHSPR
jgi:hypothetical protein